MQRCLLGTRGSQSGSGKTKQLLEGRTPAETRVLAWAGLTELHRSEGALWGLTLTPVPVALGAALLTRGANAEAASITCPSGFCCPLPRLLLGGDSCLWVQESLEFAAPRSTHSGQEGRGAFTPSCCSRWPQGSACPPLEWPREARAWTACPLQQEDPGWAVSWPGLCSVPSLPLRAVHSLNPRGSVSHLQ